MLRCFMKNIICIEWLIDLNKKLKIMWIIWKYIKKVNESIKKTCYKFTT